MHALRLLLTRTRWVPSHHYENNDQTNETNHAQHPTNLGENMGAAAFSRKTQTKSDDTIHKQITLFNNQAKKPTLPKDKSDARCHKRTQFEKSKTNLHLKHD